MLSDLKDMILALPPGERRELLSFLREACGAQKFDVELKMTCGACPEQYDAFCNGKLVGYLRLRHGYFRVDVPDCGGETIFEAHPQGDGIFEADERAGYLRQACQAISNWLEDHPERLDDQ